MNTWRPIVMMLAFSVTLVLPAAEPPAAPGTPSKPATPATPAVDAGAKTEEPDRFESTEKVRADFEVSFPVDI